MDRRYKIYNKDTLECVFVNSRVFWSLKRLLDLDEYNKYDDWCIFLSREQMLIVLDLLAISHITFKFAK